MKNKELLLEISYDCNLNYIHCSSVGCHNQKLSLDDIKRIVNIDEINVVRISGGESLLNNDLDSYCRFFKGNDVKVILQTNGTFSSLSNQFNNVYEFIDEIWISYYGNSDIHNFITGEKYYNITRHLLLSVYDDIKLTIQSPIFNEIQLQSLLYEIHNLEKTFNLSKYNAKLRLFALLNQGRCNFAMPIKKQIDIYNKLYRLHYKNTEITCSLDPTKCNYENKLVLKPDGSLFNCASHKHGKQLCKK